MTNNSTANSNSLSFGYGFDEAASYVDGIFDINSNGKGYFNVFDASKGDNDPS